MAHKLLATTVLVLGLGAGAVSGQPQPRTFFKEHAKLSDNEIQKIEQGQVVTKVLASTDKYGLLVFGAVFVNAPIEKFAEEIVQLKHVPARLRPGNQQLPLVQPLQQRSGLL